MCFGPSTFGAAAKTRLESRFCNKEVSPHFIYDCFSPGASLVVIMTHSMMLPIPSESLSDTILEGII